MKDKLGYLAFISIFTLIAMDILTRVFGIYKNYPIMADIPLHLFGGMVAAIFFLWLYDGKETKIIIPSIVLAIAWEIIEAINDYYVPQPDYALDFFFWDGILDIIFHIVGTIIIVYVWKNFPKIKNYLLRTEG